MKLVRLKTISLIAIIALCMTNVSALDGSFIEVVDHTVNVVDEYLLDAGYPREDINRMSDDIKHNLYEEKCTLQSVDTSYGIKTDKYDITYKLDENGDIDIDNENLNELYQYMNDKNEIAKVLYYKEANVTDSVNMVNEQQSESANISARQAASSDNSVESEIESYSSKNSVRIDTLSKEDPIMVLSSSTNFTSSLYVSHVSFNSSSKRLEKKITYSWDWDYDPIQKQNDKIGIAYSKGFEIIQSSTCSSYSVRATKHYQGVGSSALTWYPTNIKESHNISTKYGADAYNDYNSTVGMGTSVKFIDYYKHNDDSTGVRWYAYAHYGSFSFNIMKFYGSSINDVFTVKAEYWHKTVAVDGSFTFSDEPSLTLSWQTQYDRLDMKVTDPVLFLVGKK